MDIHNNKKVLKSLNMYLNRYNELNKIKDGLDDFDIKLDIFEDYMLDNHEIIKKSVDNEISLKDVLSNKKLIVLIERIIRRGIDMELTQIENKLKQY